MIIYIKFETLIVFFNYRFNTDPKIKYKDRNTEKGLKI